MHIKPKPQFRHKKNVQYRKSEKNMLANSNKKEPQKKTGNKKKS